MAETILVNDTNIPAEPNLVPPSRLSWSAVFGGALFAVGVWLLLHLLGMGIGLTAIDPNNPNTLRGAGIGTGIWSLIVPLIALFIGGFVASRVTTTFDRTTGAIHGAIVWALTSVFGAALIVSALGAIIGTVGQAAGTVAHTATQAVQGGGGETLSALEIDENALLAPVNQRLAQQGSPPVRTEQLGEATRDALRMSVQQGRFDRETMITALSTNTAMSRDEAERAAIQIETRFNQRIENLGRGALSVAEDSGPVLLWAFGAMLLGLISSVLGAVLGVRSRERKFVRVAQGRRTIVTSGEPIPT